MPLPAPQGLLLLLLLLRPQDTTLKLCLIRSVCLISQAVCHSAQSGDFSFSRKAEVVSQMLVRGSWKRFPSSSRSSGPLSALLPGCQAGMPPNASPAEGGAGDALGLPTCAGDPQAVQAPSFPTRAEESLPLGWGGLLGVVLTPSSLPQDFIKAEPPDSLRTPIRQRAMTACMYLVYPCSAPPGEAQKGARRAGGGGGNDLPPPILVLSTQATQGLLRRPPCSGPPSRPKSLAAEGPPCCSPD